MPRRNAGHGSHRTRIGRSRTRAVRCRPIPEALEVRALLATFTAGMAPYPKIADAVMAANANPGPDIVEVLPGVYREQNIPVNSPMTIVSTGGAAVTFIDGFNDPAPVDGTMRIFDTGGDVTIGGPNQGFTFRRPVESDATGVIASISTGGATGVLTIQDNIFIGRPGSATFDIGITGAGNQGPVIIQNNEFANMWQGVFLQQFGDNSAVRDNTFQNLNIATFTPPGGPPDVVYEPEGIFALTLGGPANDIDNFQVTGNTFTGFNGLSITLSGGYEGYEPAKFTNARIEGNITDAIGFAEREFRAGITLINDAEPGQTHLGGVQDSTIRGNEISAQVSCAPGSTGIWVLGPNNNLTIENNIIRDLDRGIAVEEQVAGAGFAAGMEVHENAIVGNTFGILNASGNAIDAEANYWGTTRDATRVRALANGGVLVDYSPWIGDGTDTSILTGFQPNVDATTLYTDELQISGSVAVQKDDVYVLNLTTLPGAPAFDRWRIDWGDGDVSQPASGAALALHTYTTPGKYVITAEAIVTNPTPPPNFVPLVQVANTVEVDVTEFDTLVVTDFVPTDSGFEAEFSQIIDAFEVNLYATESLGPADVVVTRNGIPVQGSLTFDSNRQRITFVKTGGPLEAGATYDVVLRSAANGFEDEAGNLLDGNADGTPGDDFTTSFVAPGAASDRVISLPDFARGPQQVINIPIDTNSRIPVRISDGTGVVAIELTLRYDPELIEITNVLRGLDTLGAARVTTNLTIPGVAYICFRQPTELGAGPKNFLRIVANVKNTAPSTDKQVLDLEDIVINPGMGGITGRPDDAVHVVGYLGDVDANYRYTPIDAALTFQRAQNLNSGFVAYQNADPVIIADVNNSGTVTPFDATILFQRSQNLPSPLPAIPNAQLGNPIAGGPDPLVFVQDASLTVGRRGVVAVDFEQTNPTGEDVELAAVDLAIAFDPATVRVLGAQPGAMIQDAFHFDVRIDEAAGVVHVSAAMAPRDIAFGVSGTLVDLQVEAVGIGTTSLNLLGATSLQMGDGTPLTLIPTPTDASDDAVDGRLAVSRPVIPGIRVAPIGLAPIGGVDDDGDADSGPDLMIDTLLESHPDNALVLDRVARERVLQIGAVASDTDGSGTSGVASDDDGDDDHLRIPRALRHLF